MIFFKTKFRVLFKGDVGVQYFPLNRVGQVWIISNLVATRITVGEPKRGDGAGMYQ